MSSYLDIAKKVTVSNTQGSSSADRERECSAVEPADVAPTPGLTLLSRGLGVGEKLFASARAVPLSESIAQTPAAGDSYADREFDRFEKVAVPMAGGGWFDPINGSAAMPSGVSGERWDKFVRDCANLGRKKKSKDRRRQRNTDSKSERLM